MYKFGRGLCGKQFSSREKCVLPVMTLDAGIKLEEHLDRECETLVHLEQVLAGIK